MEVPHFQRGKAFDYTMEYVQFLRGTATHVRTLAYMWQSWLKSSIILPMFQSHH